MSTSTNGDNSSPKKSSSNRMPMPSLNQLAARMTSKSDKAGADNATTPTARPRLAASILRTTSSASNASNASAASSNDSVAVQPAGSTRAPSPVSSQRSSSTTPGPEGGDPLTSDRLDKLEKLNSASSVASSATVNSAGSDPGERDGSKDKGMPAPKGYKNIPSLDAITARLAKTRALSIDGTSKPPDPEMIDDPKTPGLQVMKEEHPLQFPWTLYHDSKSKFPYSAAPNSANPTGAAPPLAPHSTASSTSNSPTTATDPSQPATHAPAETHSYEANLTVIGTFTTVEQFCRYFNWLKPPSLLDRSTNSNYHLFKAPIKPMWEDPANANGGKWVITMRNQPELLDRCWSWACMALVGEELEEIPDGIEGATTTKSDPDSDLGEICGVVVSLRSKVDRIQVWIRSRDNVERINAIGKKLVKVLDVGEKDGIGLEFQYNTDDYRADRSVPSKFLSIQALPNTSYRSTFQGLPNAAPGPGNPPGAAAAPNGGHAHSRSIGGIGVVGSGGFTPVEQTPPPLSAGVPNSNPGAGAGAFGNFGVPLGAGNGWRRR
ncbi:translation initiation factor eIF 4e-like domain-containing protein [Rhodocollybia butyracea]|uniref:Translation initiation factor eIF 4e-like domain-containing protein n=1 Tax=Rhodocollybia butyracea TaxID=206335 RepID=A0A9P5PWV9_9AGAR|nr:translation initiation factor eIF 4e-like domain-containing protein [Rhodocollybia butyracea]